MKKLLTICLVAIMSLTFSLAVAQQPTKKIVVETTQFTAKIDTPSTENKIVKTFSNDKGVVDVKVDAKKDIVTISYDRAKLDDGKLLKEFDKIKVKAQVIKPTPSKK